MEDRAEALTAVKAVVASCKEAGGELVLGFWPPRLVLPQMPRVPSIFTGDSRLGTGDGRCV